MLFQKDPQVLGKIVLSIITSSPPSDVCCSPKKYANLSTETNTTSPLLVKLTHFSSSQECIVLWDSCGCLCFRLGCDYHCLNKRIVDRCMLQLFWIVGIIVLQRGRDFNMTWWACSQIMWYWWQSDSTSSFVNVTHFVQQTIADNGPMC